MGCELIGPPWTDLAPMSAHRSGNGPDVKEGGARWPPERTRRPPSSSGGAGGGGATTTELELSTASASGSEKTHGRSSRSLRWWPSLESIQWDKLYLGASIKPYFGNAHCGDDINFVSCVLEAIKMTEVEGSTIKLLLRALRFLRLCDYSAEDICSVLAHAIVYFNDTFAVCGGHMDRNEIGNVFVTLMFVAHCYVQDETCPLHVWHKHLFRRYCTVSTLNAAVVRLLEIRRFKLRIDSEVLQNNFTRLFQTTTKFRARQQISTPSPTGGYVLSPT
eukprot:TRINITY_DN21058_c0_g1_i1.p1 TRINITY_DN21058_c0_g1~~TRINITY_DN21058_c0_g1_i1.p1  ORF type:complete len:276 (-),score=41.15 TRINITY_DN21058_c0_g1_i1:72-899(-)